MIVVEGGIQHFVQEKLALRMLISFASGCDVTNARGSATILSFHQSSHQNRPWDPADVPEA